MLKNQPYEFQCRGRVKVKGKGEMTTYFLTDRKQPATVRVDDIALMKHPLMTDGQSVMALYGGVITPLALVHQQLRQVHQLPTPPLGAPLQQLRPVGRSSSSSSSRDRRSPLHQDGRFHPLAEDGAPALVPPAPPSAYHPVPRFSKYPYVQHQQPLPAPTIPFKPQLQQQPKQQPNPPVPRHGGTPPRNGRFATPPRIQAVAASAGAAASAAAVSAPSAKQMSLSPIRSCSETESGGSPLGKAAGPIQLQKSPSAPPLKRPILGFQPIRTPFEFPAPPPSSSSNKLSVRGLRHRSDESLSGIGSSMRGEMYSTWIHSSADDLSSANRSERSESESDSSSDESYTKTEAEADSPRSSPHFRLPSLLPLSLDIEKAWSRMNAEFTADGHRPESNPAIVSSPVAKSGEAIELLGAQHNNFIYSFIYLFIY